MIPIDEARALAACAEAERKRRSTLQAGFALAGHELVCTESGELFACRWGHARRLRDLDEAEQFLARIGGAAA